MGGAGDGEKRVMPSPLSAARPTALLALVIAAGCLLAVALFLAIPAGDGGRAEGASQEVGTVIEATDLITDTVWTAAGNPYEVRGSVWIQPGITLTIDRGVRLLLAGDGGINGQGNLAIRGTPDERAIIEGPPPPVGSFPLLGITVAGSQKVEYADLRSISIQGCLASWPGKVYIRCQGEPFASFHQVNLVESYLNINAAGVRITDSKVTRSYGISVSPAEIVGNLIWLGQKPYSPYPFISAPLAINSGTVMSNSIIYNGNGGVYAELASGTSITVTANNIYGNAGWDFAAIGQHTGGPPRAPNNWWGTTDLATIQSHITGTAGFPPALDFLPIATGPIAGVPAPYAAYFPLVMAGAAGW